MIDAAQFVASNDLDLVHASKKGDVAVFEQLVKRYDRRILRISQTVTRNREDSEDAVQEALLKAFQNLPEFREDAQFSTWLIRITVNQSLMKLRKQRAPTKKFPWTRSLSQIWTHFQGTSPIVPRIQNNCVGHPNCEISLPEPWKTCARCCGRSLYSVTSGDSKSKRPHKLST
jgi:hypothetical protein